MWESLCSLKSYIKHHEMYNSILSVAFEYRLIDKQLVGRQHCSTQTGYLPESKTKMPAGADQQ